jgi:mono/diheme cytochrome c family protein
MADFSTVRYYKQVVRRAHTVGNFKWLLCFTAAVLMIMCLTNAQRAAAQNDHKDQAPAGNPGNGKKLYDTNNCNLCHGVTGEGGGTGPQIAPDPIEFPKFIGQLRHPADQMPSYDEKMVSDAEVADIYAFLKSPEQTPKAKGPGGAGASLFSSR